MNAFARVLSASAPRAIAICAAVFVNSAVHARVDDSRGAAPETVGVGTVRAPAIDPRDSMTLYASTHCAGVVKTTNGGASWTAMNNGLGGLDVSVLAIDPSNPQTVYAVAGGRVFKSTDGGASWTPMNNGLDAAGALVIDPSNPQTLYALNGGVFKSTDGAASWTAMNNGLGSRPGVSALAIDPSNPQTVYALGSGECVFKSTDGGASWTAMNTCIGGNATPVLAIDPSNPQTVYATAGDRGVFKSTDGGASWTAMNDGLANAVVFGLAIDPGSPQTVYAVTVRYPRSLLFKSTDGARTWRALNMDAGYGLTIDAAPPHTLYAARDPGLFKSIDGGDSWKGVTGLARNIVCGDGLAATQCDEQCDDGNSIDGDGCDSNCRVTTCGNGIVTAGEQCDDGDVDSCDGCSATCQIELGLACGDGLVNALCGEQCDDGNGLSCDGCSATCQTELGARCGDGIVNATCDERCDDGNLIDGDGCDSNCTLTACGNGIVTAGEECEDGNRNPLDGCTNACTICGNGVVTPPEQCDGGAAGLSDDCTPACTRCGNVDGSDACADGNTVGGDGCAANCTVEGSRKVRLDASSSAITSQSSAFSLSRIRISGQLTLQVGRARDTAEGSETPIAVRAGDLRIRIPVLGQCFCLVAIEDPALGGGVAGRGTVSCAEPLAGVDIVSSVDHNTSDVDPACEHGFLEDGSYYPNSHPHRGVCNGSQTIAASGTGPSGSARLDLRMGSYPFPGTCEVETSTQICGARGCLPAKGADGIPCTEDDPLPDTSVVSPLVSRTAPIQRSGSLYRLLPSLFDLRLTTGKAEAEIRDVNGEPGRVIGKGVDCGGGACVSEVAGSALDCSVLGQAQGSDLVSGAFAAAFPALDNYDLGDTVTTLRIGAALCTGDCNRDDSVTIDELLKGANMALGVTPAGDCPSFDTNGDDRVTIDELIAAVNMALNGCEP